MRIGLGERRRDAERRGREDHRPGHEPAAAEHHVGPARAQDAAARARGGARQHQRARERDRRPAGKTGDAKGVELVAGFRNQTRFDAIRRPGERHVDAALRQGVRYCERGQDVSCRSPGCDQTPQLSLYCHVERC